MVCENEAVRPHWKRKRGEAGAKKKKKKWALGMQVLHVRDGGAEAMIRMRVRVRWILRQAQ